MKIIIMAGGKGTRIASVNSEVPKPMIPIEGKPILQYQIECLVKQGFKDIYLVIGFLGEQIKMYFGNGENFGASIKYIVEEKPLGTAGALCLLKDELKEDFLLINGDIIFDINITRFAKYHYEKKGLATIFTHPNDHPYDSGIIVANTSGIVTNWLHKEDERKWYKNRVNAGLHMLSPKVLDVFQSIEKKDLDRDVLKPLITSQDLIVYDSPEYVKDMGTPDRYVLVSNDIATGKVASKNLNNKQKCVFLDRDGTINKYVGFLRNINDFELLEGVSEAIRKINHAGYLCIVVTNQPVIARGELSEKQLDEIHNKMETLLGKDGAYLDAIFYCPHHPHSGYDGERKELKIDCECRKPKAGMLSMAADDYNIELLDSYMIGDSENDILCGNAARCHTFQISNEESLLDIINREIV